MLYLIKMIITTVMVMSKDNTLFYCLGVIGVFLIISLAKSKKGSNQNNTAASTAPEPSPVQPPKEDNTTPSSPAPSVPGNNGSGGLAGTVVKPPTKSLINRGW